MNSWHNGTCTLQTYMIVNLFIEDIAPSTAQGHLRDIYQIKSYTTFILCKRKTYKHNPKVSPFGIAFIKKTANKS